MKKLNLTPKLRNNWLIDATLFFSATFALLSGIYFLAFPVGGFQGGRNPYYGIIILFSRHTWGDLHTWSSLIMTAVAVVHIAIHWKWIVGTTRRIFKAIFHRSETLGTRLLWNIFLDAMIGLSFIICAISGVYFLFVDKTPKTIFLFSRTIWDLLHTWSGITMSMAAILHFTLHWQWIVNVTKKMFNVSKVRPSISNQNKAFDSIQ